MKECSTCKQVKAKSEFQVRKASRDGFTASCKACLQQRDAARYLKERKRRAERHKLYMQTENGKFAHAKALSAWKEKHAVRRAANVIFNNAVRAGKVKPHPCWVCGKKAEGHHPDYDRPLDVVWLCPAHHKQAHALVRS